MGASIRFLGCCDIASGLELSGNVRFIYPVYSLWLQLLPVFSGTHLLSNLCSIWLKLVSCQKIDCVSNNCINRMGQQFDFTILIFSVCHLFGEGRVEEKCTAKKMLNKALIQMFKILKLGTLIGSGISVAHHKSANLIKGHQFRVRRPSFASHPRTYMYPLPWFLGCCDTANGLELSGNVRFICPVYSPQLQLSPVFSGTHLFSNLCSIWLAVF